MVGGSMTLKSLATFMNFKFQPYADSWIKVLV